MTERTMIEGWRCSVSPRGTIRTAITETSDGHRYCASLTESGYGFSSATFGPLVFIPLAVARWLLVPTDAVEQTTEATAYARGLADGAERERARVATWLRFVPVTTPAPAAADLIGAGLHLEESE